MMCNYGCSPLPFCQKPKISVPLVSLLLSLGEEEEESAVGEAIGDVLHIEDGKLLLLVGTSCCAEPSLEVFHISPALAGPASLAWDHQG